LLLENILAPRMGLAKHSALGTHNLVLTSVVTP
jgi:hypothetical protein